MAKGTIILSDGGELKLAANAATKYRYREIFGEDMLVAIASAGEDLAVTAELYEKMAYVMMLQAEKKAASGSKDGFMEWLDTLSANDIIDNAEEIIDIYMSNKKTLSKEKNQAGPQSAR